MISGRDAAALFPSRQGRQHHGAPPRCVHSIEMAGEYCQYPSLKNGTPSRPAVASVGRAAGSDADVSPVVIIGTARPRAANRLHGARQIFGRAFRQHVALGPDRKVHSIEPHLLHGLCQFRVIQLRQMLRKKAERRTARRCAGSRRVPACRLQPAPRRARSRGEW